MTDLNKIIAGAKSIERILTEQFGGTGRGMKEKLDSARFPIPAPLQQRVAYLARLRNRCVHEEGFEIQDADDYARKCQAVCAELQQVHAIAVRVAQTRVRPRGGNRLLPLGVGVLLLGTAWMLLRPAASVHSTSEPAVAAQMAAETAAPAVENLPAAKEGELVRSGDNVGIGNDVLHIESIAFTYRKGSFGDLEPSIQLELRNLSDRTISSARIDARLYVNRESAPIVDTDVGFRKGPLFVFFGDSGLAPGQRRKVDVSLFGDDRWALPDAINASRRALFVRIAQVTDGRKQDLPVGVRAWPAVSSGLAPAASKPASATTSPETYRQRFLAGEHVALSDNRLEIEKMDLSMKSDSWGEQKPSLALSLRNHAGVTLGYARFRVQLFIDKEKEAVIDSGADENSKGMFVYFGKKGLADGAGTTLHEVLDYSVGNNWNAPDVRKAIREKRARIVLRLSTLSDGRGNTFASMATPITPM